MPAPATLPQVTAKPSIFLSTPSVLRQVSYDTYQTETVVKSNNFGCNLAEAQEIICNFFLEIVKQWPANLVLKEFNELFINPVMERVSSKPSQALNQIILSKDEARFKNTLKRCCYILVNNWISERSYQPTQDLIKIFSESTPPNYLLPLVLKHLKAWVTNFIHSEDYEELKLFVAKFEEKKHWKCRYTSYLLASQYTNTKNSTEHRQAARILSKQLQDQFKMDLAMYTARSQVATFKNSKSQNPTALGDEALRLVKKILSKRGSFSYPSLANIFLNQTRQFCYKDFKQSLLKYLIFSENNKGLVETLKIKLGENLEFLYEKDQEEELNNHLLLKTCNRVIEYLTTEKSGEPSPLFVLLASQGNPLTLAVILVRIILICPQARTHLETCVAKLIQYYEDYSQTECQWVINFLEVLRIILTVYNENVQYNLVNMRDDEIVDEELYRIFSQIKYRK